ncbi:MAG: hypothetical protein ACXVUL_15090 [Solirubrobacteraceae bacterium]
MTIDARPTTAAAVPRSHFQAPELIHVVADYGPSDEAFVGLTRRLALFAPAADVVLTQVAARDSLAAGFWVACLALGDAPGNRLVVHDVAARLARNAQPRECAGWTANGVAIVGPDTGWSWSFVAREISGPCYLELPTAERRAYSPELLAGAIVRAVVRHSHAVCEPIPPEAIPPVPDCVVALVDRHGVVSTTISRPPAPVGKHVRVQIGEVRATAVVSDDSVEVARGELALGPTSRRWRRRDGERCSFHDLFIPGGSAAERFSSPATGMEIILERTQD